MNRWVRRVIRGGIILLASAAAVVAAEAIVRVLDGYSLGSWPLLRHQLMQAAPASTEGKLVNPTAAAVFVPQIAVADGIARQWFDLDPAPLPDSPINDELLRRYARHPGHELESVYEWNRAYVVDAVCGISDDIDDVGEAVFRHLEDIYVFDPADGTGRPAYRFLPKSHYPSGLRTNSFGWRGGEIDPAKPATKLRVAFVGASTTVGAHDYAFSYPEYVGRWLQEWVRARHPGLDVDVINAGREGIESSSIAGIIEHELRPLAPDVVVYYEGANQFWPTNFVVNDVPLRLMRRMKTSPWLATHSALAGRILQLTRPVSAGGAEPAKPPVWVRWPSDLREDDPALDHPQLPVQLPAILADLDRMRRVLTTDGGVLMLSSFMWLVEDGLILDPRRDAMLFDYLNQSYWPFSYAHVRRFVDFENRVFRKYAAAHDLPFIDAASAFPKDPRLFFDGIHMTAAGVKLYAWLVLQELVPHLEAAVMRKDLPRSAPHQPAAAPTPRRRLESLADIRASCPHAS